MLAEFIAPAGIRDGDAQALAELCAAGGSAVVAYCEAAGASPRVGEAATWALATFRRHVADDRVQDAAQLELLLLSVTRDAALRMGDAQVTAERLQAADAAFASQPLGRLAPTLARDLIWAVVAAAPVAGSHGDEVAVRAATARRYAQIFEHQDAQAGALAPAATAGGAMAWVPAELLLPTADGSAADTDADTSVSRWHGAPEASDPPAFAPLPDSPAFALPPDPPAYAPLPDPPGFAQPPPAAQHAHPVAPLPVPTRSGRLRPRLPRRWLRPARPPGGAAPRDGRALVAGAIAIVAVAIAVIVLARPESEVKQGTIVVRPLDTPFGAAGAVFDIARTRTAEWAIEIRRREPRPGRKWLTLAAHTRNVSRANFHPRALGYRLRTTSGIVIGPETAMVSDTLSDAGGRLRAGRRSSVHLGFQVPEQKTDFSLEFDPGPGSPRIRVPLN